MDNRNEIVKLAIDGYKGSVEKYSVEQSQRAVREALVDMLGGKTELTYKDMLRGNGNEVFALIEEILAVTDVDGLQGNEFFYNFVEYRNLALGDMNEFIVEDSNLFEVANIAEGTQGIRRQRIGGSNKISIQTNLKAIRIYEELNRVLAGKVDFNNLIAKVSESFQKQILNDIYDLWTNVTANQLGGATYFPAAGTYDEDAMIDLVSNVEAAAGGRTATIVGTKRAIRNLAPSIQGADSKSDLYNMG